MTIPDGHARSELEATAIMCRLERRMKLSVPELSLVVLVGCSGSGKSTFARKYFKPTEVLSSDFCRGLVSDDENSQAATTDAFDVLHYVATKRLTRGLLTVVDATNVQEEARKPLVALAREHDVLPVAVVLALPEDVCHARNRERADRSFGPHVIRQQSSQLRRSVRHLQREGFRHVFLLESAEDVEAAVVERVPLWNNRRGDHGPFDIIGDVHGCYDELVELLGKLGYGVRPVTESAGTSPGQDAQATGDGPVVRAIPPAGRKVVFVGDLVDRGPKVVEVLKLVMGMVRDGTALCVPGNHDVKLMRKLRGKDVQVKHGLLESLEQLAREGDAFKRDVADFIDSLVSHYVLDDGRLVVAHAGMKERYQGRGSGRVREFALYGETTGETDEFGLPVRYNWASEYRGSAAVVYGHTPVPEADWLNRTINIDTGCVFGGKLTALRWPEKELVSVPAKRVYAEPARPFIPEQPVPAFGQRVDGEQYTDRPGAYGVIRDEAGRIAVVQADGAVYLPGGGADPGETPEQTLRREAREECGWDAEVIGGSVGRAVQHVTTRSGKHFAKQCTYFQARFLPGTECTPTEADHALMWLNVDEALRRLVLDADVWAVKRVVDPSSAVAPLLSAQQQADDLLDIEDVVGKRIVTTRLMSSVTVREENAIAALEVMSRFAADPKWLVYLPPTMSPTETTREPGLLEHPREAFGYFRSNGVARVVCEEKHMGSRAIMVVCRDEPAARKRFGVSGDGAGIAYTRTGRRFFEDRAVEAAVLDRVRRAMDSAGFWTEFASDWFCLDCELMPWSAKAQDLLRGQYAAVGSAARSSLTQAVPELDRAVARSCGDARDTAAALVDRYRSRQTSVKDYVDAYRRYCWTVTSADDLRVAPFHLLASENAVHVDKDHLWHMRTLARLADGQAGEVLMATAHHVVDLADPASEAAGVAWWEDRTARGGEGMVVKPIDFVVRGPKGLVQPAVKCRGKEYLRIIYGPEYTLPAHLDRLRSRGLGAKRSLALREFALGVEALERFVRREPLRRVHECVFGVLALESEPVDPRL
jgi:predicted kinase/8-oxo-dGTP pyrophosphatase MutT (NUDIX family)/diadenosine tetraphosphatase ApaH/serine/threonine PP2A family protein phosphatase